MQVQVDNDFFNKFKNIESLNVPETEEEKKKREEEEKRKKEEELLKSIQQTQEINLETKSEEFVVPENSVAVDNKFFNNFKNIEGILSSSLT